MGDAKLTFDADEFFDLTRRLESHHLIFSRLWMLGRPVLTDDVDVAAVTFDSDGEQLQFLLNPEAWYAMTPEQQTFVIAHECMHCILHHGVRAVNLSREDDDDANIAMDIVVNHFLVRSLGFDRSVVDPENEACWVDTVFDPRQRIPSDETFEYYYQLLTRGKQGGKGSKGEDGSEDGPDRPSGKQGQKGSGPSTLDDHRFLSRLNDMSLDGQLSQTAERDDVADIKGFIEKQELDIAIDIHSRGLTPGNVCCIANVARVKRIRKWETVIKKWAKRAVRDNEIEQWTRTDRRLVTLSPDFFIPTWVEDETYKRDRITVWFFQDTSGSCAGLANRFFRAAKTLPPDRFDVRMFCFDTRVYETSLKSGQLYGFGGTSFICIEQYIQQEIQRTGAKYPRAVWVVTDGLGDAVHPEMPERWHWFLSMDFRDYIPAASDVHMLADFE